ncbi:MAG: hypothetical protein RLP45_00315, partial [Haliea sp.]
DEFTQQNAAMVEEAAAASKSMDDQSKTLQELVSIFNTGDDAAPAPAPLARPRAQPQAAGNNGARRSPAPAPAPAAKRRPPSSASATEEWEEF